MHWNKRQHAATTFPMPLPALYAVRDLFYPTCTVTDRVDLEFSNGTLLTTPTRSVFMSRLAIDILKTFS